MKPRNIFLLAILFIFIWGWEIPSLLATTKEELQQSIKSKLEEIKQLETEAERYRNEIEEKGKEATTLKKNIALIETRIKALNHDITKTRAEIEKTSLQIEVLTNELTEIEKTIVRQQEGLREVLKNLYEAGSQNSVQLALKSATFSDVFNLIEYFAALQQSLQESLKGLKELKGERAIAQKEAKTKKTDLEGLRSRLTNSKLAAQNEEQGKKTIFNLTKNEEARFQQLLKQTEAERINTLRDIEKLEDELRLTIDPNSVPVARKGLLEWPISFPRSRVTQGYGATEFAQNSDFYKFHNGIDICIVRAAKKCNSGSVGEPVLAAEDGEVIATGNTDSYCWGGSYGRYVVIKHEKLNLTTLYSHLASFSITKGSIVNRGQVIGGMGATGLVTGPHLHFTVYSSPTVSFRPSRVCGILPYGGSLNPMDYL